MSKQVFILHHLKINRVQSYPKQLNYNIFTIMKEYLEKNNLKIFVITDFIKSDSDRNKIINMEENYKLNDKELNNIYIDSVINMMDYIVKNNVYDGIIMGFQPYGFDRIFDKNYAILKKQNFKTILWQDDLHAFNNVHNKPIDEIVSDHRLDKADIILTPSTVYYKNTSNPYLDKSIFYFYCLNENWYNEININNYKSRINKILLSGCCSKGYTLRHDINLFYNKNKELKDNTNNKYNIFYDYIDVLQHPKHDRHNNKEKIGLNYLKILASYKGAFFGFFKKPLNYPLAKIIEILGSGTLGFFEDSPILEEQLGLIKFKHYIPILVDKNNKMIFESDYYLKFLNSSEGENIAINGCKYVRDQFTMKNKCDDIVKIINNI